MQGAYSEFVKCYSCCVSDDGNCDTTQRCQPGTAIVEGKGGHPAGAADLHDMANCFKVARQDIDYIGYSVRSFVVRIVRATALLLGSLSAGRHLKMIDARVCLVCP